MLVTWRYRNLPTFIHRLDPRAKLIAFGCYVVAVLSLWDLRLLLGMLVFGLLQVFAARLSWRDTGRVWLFILLMATLFGVITLLTGRGGFEFYSTEHELARWTASFPVLGWRPEILLTSERIAYALCQVTRIFAVTAFSLSIPYTIDPRFYGVAFRRLGLPDKFAYAMDLSFRFVPTFARDFSITYDAQRARGYEMERLRGGLIGQIRRVAPLLIPVVIQAIVGGEEIIDAMDLRSFGVRPRTWLLELRYRWFDWMWIGLGVCILAGSIILPAWGLGRFWVPPFLLP